MGMYMGVCSVHGRLICIHDFGCVLVIPVHTGVAYLHVKVAWYWGCHMLVIKTYPTSYAPAHRVYEKNAFDQDA